MAGRLALAALLLAPLGAPHAAEAPGFVAAGPKLTLVRDAQPAATIVVAKRAGQAVLSVQNCHRPPGSGSLWPDGTPVNDPAPMTTLARQLGDIAHVSGLAIRLAKLSKAGARLPDWLLKVAVERGATRERRDFDPSLPPDNPPILGEEIGIAPQP